MKIVLTIQERRYRMWIRNLKNKQRLFYERISERDGFKTFMWKYITLRSYFGRGMGEVYHLRTVVLLSGILGTYLNTRGDLTNSTILIIMGTISLAMFIGFTYLGYIWDSCKLIHMESEWGAKRNPFIKETRQNLGIKEKKYGV